MDITTTEVADYVVGGVMACDSSRFDAILEKKIPLVLSVGALDIVNFGTVDTIPPNFQQRKIHIHNEQVIIGYEPWFSPLSLHYFWQWSIPTMGQQIIALRHDDLK